MEENFESAVEPLTGVVSEILDQICDACGDLSLSNIRNAPSISLRQNHGGLDQMKWLRELILNPPIVLKASRIQSIQANCSVCNLIRQYLGNDSISAEQRIHAYKCEGLEDKIESLWIYFPNSKEAFLKLNLFADEGSLASKYLLYRPVSDQRSDQSFQDINDWITTCNNSHPRCRYSISGAKMKHRTTLPTRVIDVGDSADEVRLVISNKMTARYVALSHCWGGSSHCRTLKSSLEQHKSGIKTTSLPRTIQDAVSIVQKLGLRYLWVDSLCIIQDDDDDWFREAGQMAAVYEGAYLTIAASASADGSGGCFVSRGHQELLRLPCQKGNTQPGHMYLGVADDDAAQRMFRGHLNKRAWVLQEHLFARRTVHYAADQIYWECDKFLMGQDRSNPRPWLELEIPTRALLCCILGDFLGPNRMPHLVKVPPQECFDRVDYYNWWANTIRYFSNCCLTKQKDKLTALLSLSTELGKLTGDEYHEGHWHWPSGTPLFISSLLWLADNGSYLTKSDHFRAPTWSWAALEGPLSFADMNSRNLAHIFHPEDSDLQFLKVQNFQPLGLPRRKALLLSAVLIRASKIQSCSERKVKVSHECMPCKKSENQTCIKISGENGEEIAGAFMFDLEDTQPSSFWLLPTFSRWTVKDRPAPIYYALLVAEVPNQRAAGIICERVGIGHIEDARIVYGRSRQFVVLI